MTIEQQGDVLICQTLDEGDIAIEDGLFVMSPGLESMAYLCLFGGNVEDDGSLNNALQYWGNFTEPDLSRQYRSETQHLLAGLPATANNLRRVKQAVERDLQVLLDEGIVSSLTVAVSIPRLNWVRIEVNIDGEETPNTRLEYDLNWKAYFS